MLSIAIISEKEIEVSGGGEFRVLLLFKLRFISLRMYFFCNLKNGKKKSRIQQTRHAGGEAYSVSTAYILGACNVIVRVI